MDALASSEDEEGAGEEEARLLSNTEVDASRSEAVTDADLPRDVVGVGISERSEGLSS